MEESSRIIQGLRSKSLEARQTNLQKLVELIEDTQEIHSELIAGLKKLVTSTESVEKITGLSCLISICTVANETNINTLAFHFLQWVSFKNIQNKDEEIIGLASEAMGTLVNSPSSTTFELADEEFRYALSSLKLDNSKEGFPRFAACYEIKSLAQKLPILFAVYLGEFLEYMWNVIRDPKDHIREVGVETFALALSQIESREEYFEEVYKECMKGLAPDNYSHCLHGSIRALDKMLQKAPELIKPRLQEVSVSVLRLKDHKTPLIKKAAFEVIPTITQFIKTHKISDKHILRAFVEFLFKSAVSSNKEQKSDAYQTLGQIAKIIGPSFSEMKSESVNLLNIELRKKSIPPTFFKFFEGVTLSLGPEIGELSSELVVTSIFSKCELNVYLLDFLKVYTYTLLQVRSEQNLNTVIGICEKLLNMLFMILNQRMEKNVSIPPVDKSHITNNKNPFSFVEAFSQIETQLLHTPFMLHQNQTCIDCPEHSSKIQKILALHALANFDFHNTFSLGSLVYSCVLPYLEDQCAVVRKYAVITTCSLTRCPKHSNIGVVIRNELYNILERLLNVALTDLSDEVRHTLFKHLKKDFYQFLALETNLSRLMAAVNDKKIEVRRACVKLLGKLAGYNSSFILPCLTQLLSQYLSELQLSGRFKHQQDAAILLRAIIKNTKQLLCPNLPSIIEIFIQIMKNSSHAPLIYQALRGISACASVGKKHLVPHFDEVFPYLIENLKDPSMLKRKGALLAILDVVFHSTKAIEPYLRYNSLLETLLEVIKSEERITIRKLAEKTLGTLGALRPVKYKELEKSLHSGLKPHKNSSVDTHLRELHKKSLELTPSHSIYYPLVALKALTNILITSNLNHEHTGQVLYALNNIFLCYNRRISSLLQSTIPILVHVCKQSESPSKERFIRTFTRITSYVGDDINDFVAEITQIIDLSVESPSVLDEMLTLLRELASHSCYETMSSFPQLLRNSIKILNFSGDDNLIEKTLNFVSCLKGKIDQYLYITVPALLKLVQDHPNYRIRKGAIKVIVSLCDKKTHPHIVDYISRIIDAFVAVIKSESAEIVNEIFDSLTCLVEKLGNIYAVFIPVIQKVALNKKITHKRYETAVQELIAGSEEVESPIRRTRLSTLQTERSSMLRETKDQSLPGPYKYDVNVQQLLAVCETKDRHTKEEWKDWMRRFSNELLKQAPAPALRECQVIEEYPNSLELFNAAFVSCWSDLYDEDKNMMIVYLEKAFDSSTIPTEVLQVLLNLAEFMEHDDHKLFDARTLGKLAYKCKAYAKALHYKEVEFHTSAPNSEIIESLVSLNNLLHQHEAAYGIRMYARKKGWGELTQSWCQEFHRWQDAEELHEAINEMLITDPYAGSSDELTVIRMKCLKALSDWTKLMSLAEIKWNTIKEKESSRKEVASYAAAAAWNLGRWEELENYTKEMDPNNFDQTFYQAILSIHENDLPQTKEVLEKGWDIVDAKLPGLLRESYIRAYPVVVEIQQLCDIEEVVKYKTKEETYESREELLSLWNARLKGCSPSIDIWEKFLSFRPLLVTPEEDLDTWIQFSELCMKNGQMRLAGDTLETLMLRTNYNKNAFYSKIYSEVSESEAFHPASVVFVYLKYLYKQGPKQKALDLLRNFVEEQETQKAPGTDLCRYYLQLSKWQKHLMQDDFNCEVLNKALKSIETATAHNSESPKVWHKWGMLNFEALSHYERPLKDAGAFNIPTDQVMESHIDSALEGFIQSISLEYSLSNSHKLQNLLRLITIWFNYGSKPKVYSKLKSSFEILSVEVWLQVIPQIIARASTPDKNLRELIIHLLKKISKYHPHALVYPLTMAIRTSSEERKSVASEVLGEMREHCQEIVEDTMLVTSELIRCSVLWKEAWKETIVEASQLYFGAKDISGMLGVLKELHNQMNEGPTTMNEIGFYQAYSADLAEAEFWLNRYEESRKDINLQQAWNIYYNIYMKLSKSDAKEIYLENVSPKLAEAQNLNATIPGIYKSHKKIVNIQNFDKTLKVFQTKQHPRKLCMLGGNGKEYHFLLKGHEDSRQDERAMQLFGLVNDLLAGDRRTNGKDLAIRRYAVVPLSPTCGLIGWVHEGDTLNQLIQEYRQRKRIETYVERDLIKGMYSRYEHLSLINKIEIFEYAMSQTKGEDLQRILWSKSPTSEIWLERRTNYTRSLAVMSMVGYILGLGDRHPSNLMLDRYTGKIIHIDFGDCFEVAMKRERCPEKVPFRLTRMLVNAMEISGIEGNFRNTCEQVMTVLRQNKDSLMAMLEVFLYEPLVSWRIIEQEKAGPSHAEDGEMTGSVREDIVKKLNAEGEMTELLNKKAIEVLDRVLEKLTGNDFPESRELNVPAQVDRLIKEARSIRNLAQSYIGWCPFW